MDILNIIQIIVSILLVTAILLQQRGAGSSAIMGSGGGSGSYYARRGFEKFLYSASIVLAVIFLLISLIPIIIK